MMAQNLRGEMSADLDGAKLCMSDSRFIQVIAKSLSVSCKEVGRLTPTHSPQHLLNRIFNIGVDNKMIKS